MSRRDTQGRYDHDTRCDSCGAVIATHRGAEYATDTEVCGSGDGPGFFLCVDKPRCEQRYLDLSVAQRRAMFTQQRTENENAVGERRRSKKVAP